MKRLCLSIAYIFCILSVDAQNVLFEKEIKLNGTFLDPDKREAYPITNNIDKSVALFLIDKIAVKGLLFDNDFNLISELEGEKAESKYEDLLGSNVIEDTYTLFFSNRGHRVLQSVSYNFKSKVISKNVIDLAIKKERYVGSVSYNNKFYFITIPNRSSTLKVCIFNSNNNYEVKSYDFPDHHFTSDKQFFTLSDAVRDPLEQFPSNDKAVAVNIDNEIPNPLYVTSSLFKLYTYNDSIVFTLNNQPIRTNVISINVNTLQSSFKSYKQPASNCNGFSISSNSYIHNNILYQLKVCTAAMTLTIIDLRNGEKINEFNTTAEEEISFKNTPILLKGTPWVLFLPNKDEKELTKTKQFLKKVESIKAGICVYKIDRNLEMTVGGYASFEGGGFTPMGGGYTPGSTFSTPGGTVSFPATYNPTYSTYNHYKSSVSAYFKSLLNPETYDHQPGLVQINAFDKIQTLTEEIKDKITADTIFKKDGGLVLGYYLKTDDKYVMRYFKD